MKILVTGTEGFIGKKFAYWLNNNVNEVISFDIKNDQTIDDFYGIVSTEELDAVIHCGAISSTTASEDECLEWNYEFSRDVIDICTDFNVLLQLSSTAGLYGPGEIGVKNKETDKPVITNSYTLSKYMMERYAMKSILDNASKIQIFRYFNVFSYDKKDEEHKGNQASVQSKWNNLDVDQKITLFNNSNHIYRDFVHWADVAYIQSKFLKIEQDGIFNVGSGKAKTFFDIAMSSLDCEDKNSKLNFIDIPEELKRHYQYYTCADMTKTYNALKEVHA